MKRGNLSKLIASLTIIVCLFGIYSVANAYQTTEDANKSTVLDWTFVAKSNMGIASNEPGKITNAATWSQTGGALVVPLNAIKQQGTMGTVSYLKAADKSVLSTSNPAMTAKMFVDMNNWGGATKDPKAALSGEHAIKDQPNNKFSWKYYMYKGEKGFLFQKFVGEIVPNNNKAGACIIRTDPQTTNGSVFAEAPGNPNQIIASIGTSGAPITYSVTGGNRSGLMASERFGFWKVAANLVLNYTDIDGIKYFQSLDPSSTLSVALDINGDSQDEVYSLKPFVDSVFEGTTSLGGEVSADYNNFTGVSVAFDFENGGLTQDLANELWADYGLFNFEVAQGIDFSALEDGSSVLTDVSIGCTGNQKGVPEIPAGAVIPLLSLLGLGMIWLRKKASK